MSDKPKKEITAALKKLGPKLVRETLSAHSLATGSTPLCSVPDDKLNDQCIKLIVRCSLFKFARSLRESQREKVCAVLGSGNLLRALEMLDIDDLVDIVPLDLLQEFSVKLNLPTERPAAPGTPARALERDELKRHVADELTLIGMEAFLLELPEAVLREQVAKLSARVAESANRAQLVEALMVEIFQLEPLSVAGAGPIVTSTATPAGGAQAAQAVPGASAEGKKKPSSAASAASSAKKTSSAVSRKAAASSSADEEKKEKEKEQEKEKEAVAEEGTDGEVTFHGYMGKDGKWVSPPIDTIVRGRYTKQTLNDNFCLPDLVTYCKKHGVPTTNRKKVDVIKNILLYLEGHDFTARTKKRPAKRPADGEKDAKRQKTAEEDEDEDEAAAADKDNGAESGGLADEGAGTEGGSPDPTAAPSGGTPASAAEEEKSD